MESYRQDVLIHLSVKPKVLLFTLFHPLVGRHSFEAHLCELSCCRALRLDVTIDGVPLRVVEQQITSHVSQTFFIKAFQFYFWPKLKARHIKLDVIKAATREKFHLL